MRRRQTSLRQHHVKAERRHIYNELAATHPALQPALRRPTPAFAPDKTAPPALTPGASSLLFAVDFPSDSSRTRATQPAPPCGRGPTSGDNTPPARLKTRLNCSASGEPAAAQPRLAPSSRSRARGHTAHIRSCPRRDCAQSRLRQHFSPPPPGGGGGGGAKPAYGRNPPPPLPGWRRQRRRHNPDYGRTPPPPTPTHPGGGGGSSSSKTSLRPHSPSGWRGWRQRRKPAYGSTMYRQNGTVSGTNLRPHIPPCDQLPAAYIHLHSRQDRGPRPRRRERVRYSLAIDFPSHPPPPPLPQHTGGATSTSESLRPRTDLRA